MPDFTMCGNNSCPDRKICYRHEAPHNEKYQSFSYFEFDHNLGCSYFIEMEENKPDYINPLQFEYTNWQGKTGIRNVLPREVYFGSTEFHQKKQWLMKAVDLDKNDIRIFAIKDIIRFI